MLFLFIFSSLSYFMVDFSYYNSNIGVSSSSDVISPFSIYSSNDNQNNSISNQTGNGDPPIDPPIDPPGNPINNHTSWKQAVNIANEIVESNSRQIEVLQTPNSLQLFTTKRNEQKSDKIDIKIQYPSKEIDIFFQYFNKDELTIPKISFHVKIEKIVEYADLNSNFIYDSSDSSLQTLEFDGFYLSEYSEFEINNQESFHYFEVNSSDNILSFYFFIAENFIQLNNQTLTPAQLKFDIQINSFPFLENQSRLALELQMIGGQQFRLNHTTEDEKNGFSNNETALYLSESVTDGYFSWTDQVLVDGVIHPVYFNEGQHAGSVRTYFINYPRGDMIFHDPKIGIANILIIPSPSDLFWDFANPLFILLIFGIVIFLIIGLMMTKQEYRSYLLNRILPLHTSPHRLTMEEVLENETRLAIMNEIIDEPGIHYSKLLEKIDTSPSNLAWHLDILETYKIIHKQRIGNYLIFYPYLDKNPFKDVDPTLVKSKTTMEIFKLIGENPDIHINKLAKRLDLHRKTVKYHIEKLQAAELIILKKEGRKNTYSIVGSLPS